VYLIVFLTLSAVMGFSQIESKKYSRFVTNNTENEKSPTLSMDGNTLIFIKKEAMDSEWRAKICRKENGAWTRPEDFAVLNKETTTKLSGSFCLNYDATEIYFTSKRGYGVGGFDIWKIKLSSGKWSEPENLAKPVNSKLNEINPFLVDDALETKIFYTQVLSENQNGKIYCSVKKNGVWQTGVEQKLGSDFYAAKLAADHKTLYLSKIEGEKTKFYYAKWSGTAWSAPKQIVGINEKSDKFFGLSAQSTQLTISAKDSATYDLFQIKLPADASAVPVTMLSIDTKEIFKVNINSISTQKSILSATKLKNYPLLNNDNYIVQITFKSFLPVVQQVDLTKANSDIKVLKPVATALETGKILLMNQFEDEKTLNKNLLNAYASSLVDVHKANPKVKFKIIWFDKNLPNATDSTMVFATAGKYVDQLKTYFTHLGAGGILLETNALPSVATLPKGIYLEVVY
jgi:hypothetical protein